MNNALRFIKITNDRYIVLKQNKEDPPISDIYSIICSQAMIFIRMQNKKIFEKVLTNVKNSIKEIEERIDCLNQKSLNLVEFSTETINQYIDKIISISLERNLYVDELEFILKRDDVRDEIESKIQKIFYEIRRSHKKISL